MTAKKESINTKNGRDKSDFCNHWLGLCLISKTIQLPYSNEVRKRIKRHPQCIMHSEYDHFMQV